MKSPLRDRSVVLLMRSGVVDLGGPLSLGSVHVIGGIDATVSAALRTLEDHRTLELIRVELLKHGFVAPSARVIGVACAADPGQNLEVEDGGASSLKDVHGQHAELGHGVTPSLPSSSPASVDAALADSKASAAEPHQCSETEAASSKPSTSPSIVVTPEMVAAGVDALVATMGKHHFPGFDAEAVGRIYRAMSLAQPAQEEE